MQLPTALDLSAEECADLCPTLARETLAVLAPKWAAPLLLALHLAGQPIRYADLLRRLAPITPKELAKQLRELEKRELIVRTVFPTNPPTVEYGLSPAGADIYPVLVALASWSLPSISVQAKEL